MDFHVARCPECAHPAPVLGEIALEATTRFRGRYKCRRCLKRVWVEATGFDVETWMIDAAPLRLVSSA